MKLKKLTHKLSHFFFKVLDDGRLTDGQGNTINFKNTVIIATSNAGFGNEALTGQEDKDMKIMDRIAPYSVLNLTVSTVSSNSLT